MAFIAISKKLENEFRGELYRDTRAAIMRWLVAGDESARDVAHLPAPTVAALLTAGTLHATESEAVAAIGADETETVEVTDEDLAEAMAGLCAEYGTAQE